MNDSEIIKNVVKEKYGEIAKMSQTQGCCSSGCGCGDNTVDYSIMSDDYTKLNGYVVEADLKLGCGIPTEHAGIKVGDVVLDLGCGAGNDVFVARSIVGETGQVIGLDMTEEMLKKAFVNNKKLGYQNVDFRHGEIEDMPVDANSVNVVISNCVLNLVPDKSKAFSEIHRVLKPGGHFCISDIVIEGKLPEAIRKSAEMYAGCVAGAMNRAEYMKVIAENGFTKVEVKSSKVIDVPDETLHLILNQNEIKEFRESGAGIYSITVVGNKANKIASCC